MGNENTLKKKKKENDKGGKGSPKVGKKNLLVNFKKTFKLEFKVCWSFYIRLEMPLVMNSRV